MKINKRDKKKLKLPIIILSAIVVAVGAFTVFTLVTQNTNKDADSSDSIDSQIENTTPDPEPETKTKDTINDTNTDQPTPPTVDSSTNLRSVQLSVTADVSNNILFIRGGINNSIEYDGTCYATLTNPSGQSIRKDTTLLQNASTTDCKTIQVPTSELNKGQWKIVLNYSSNESTGKSNAYTIEI